MAEIPDPCETIAAAIMDYREGDIPKPDAAHVRKWLSQFPAEVQAPLIAEMNHVLSQTYITKTKVEAFLAALVKNQKLVGEQPKEFWKAAKFLDLQKHGGSQHQLLTMFDTPLRTEFDRTDSELGRRWRLQPAARRPKRFLPPSTVSVEDSRWPVPQM